MRDVPAEGGARAAPFPTPDHPHPSTALSAHRHVISGGTHCVRLLEDARRGCASVSGFSSRPPATRLYISLCGRSARRPTLLRSSRVRPPPDSSRRPRPGPRPAGLASPARAPPRPAPRLPDSGDVSGGRAPQLASASMYRGCPPRAARGPRAEGRTRAVGAEAGAQERGGRPSGACTSTSEEDPTLNKLLKEVPSLQGGRPLRSPCRPREEKGLSSQSRAPSVDVVLPLLRLAPGHGRRRRRG